MSFLSDRKFAVTGGTGFIGQHLIHRLASLGLETLSISRSAVSSEKPDRGLPLGNHRGVQALSCDVRDAEKLSGALSAFRPDVVFHLAAHPDGPECTTQARCCIETNLIGSVNVLEAAVRAGVRLLVVADSVKVFGNGPVPYTAGQAVDPVCSYAVAKAAAWQQWQVAARLSNLKVVCLRMTFVYGPRQNWNLITYVHDCFLKQQPVRLQGGGQTRDPLYVDDAVDALLAVTRQPAAEGCAIPIGGGQEITIYDLSQQVLRALNSGLEVIPNATPVRSSELWRSVSSNSDALRLLGWTPKTSLTEGLEKTFGSYLAIPRCSEDPLIADTAIAATA
ncbi:MAG: NAD-dependent epimerase/dehydratase family protein [Bryobacteraceae bacterium]|nr:NAD-dependent epimerase/dehydratase family protein [Bryobacteraceae bacterium]